MIDSIFTEQSIEAHKALWIMYHHFLITKSMSCLVPFRTVYVKNERTNQLSIAEGRSSATVTASFWTHHQKVEIVQAYPPHLNVVYCVKDENLSMSAKWHSVLNKRYRRFSTTLPWTQWTYLAIGTKRSWEVNIGEN